MFDLSVYGAAFTLAASQIVGIGPQNAFVLKQGIARSHVLPIVLICIVADTVLIVAGVFGVGTQLASVPAFIPTIAWAGAAFLGYLALKSWRSALWPCTMRVSGAVEHGRSAVLRTVLAVTLLNPYVWLDTVFLIGGLSAVYGYEGRWSFVLGSSTASILWFTAVGFGAALLAPLFQHPRSWRVLDALIGCVLLLTAASLLRNFALTG